MPAGSDYLHQRPRSPYWYYVRDVPEDVRAKAGVAKWKRSLRTTERAEAIKEARRLAVEHDQIIEDVRRSKVDRLAGLSPAERERIEASGGLDLYLEFLNRRALESRRNVDEADNRGRMNVQWQVKRAQAPALSILERLMAGSARI